MSAKILTSCQEKMSAISMLSTKYKYEIPLYLSIYDFILALQNKSIGHRMYIISCLWEIVYVRIVDFKIRNVVHSLLVQSTYTPRDVFMHTVMPYVCIHEKSANIHDISLGCFLQEEKKPDTLIHTIIRWYIASKDTQTHCLFYVETRSYRR